MVEGVKTRSGSLQASIMAKGSTINRIAPQIERKYPELYK